MLTTLYSFCSVADCADGSYPFAGTLILLAGAVVHSYHRNSAERLNSFLVGDPHEGSLLFFEKKGCARCHAVNGVGANGAPDLCFSRSPQASLAQMVSAMP